MDKSEAIEVLEKELETLRPIPYLDLKKNIEKEPITKEVTSSSGKKYYIEIITHWDDKPGGDIRVHGCVDDGGLRAFSPLSSDFIKSSNNEFIDE